MLKVNCLACGAAIFTYPSWINEGKSKYCSRACSMPITNKALALVGFSTRKRIGMTPWNKKGFTFAQARKNGKSYKLIYVPEHPFASKKGYVREHRLVMEKQIGRYLLANEIVHHRDENTLNNDIQNLELLDGKSHRILHLKDTVHKRWQKIPLHDTNNKAYA